MLPTAPKVAEAWLRSLPSLAAGVSTTLPTDVTTWATNGFVVVDVVGNAAGDVDTEMRETVLALHAWAVTPNASTPPWGKANQILEIVLTAMFDDTSFPVSVTLSPGTYDDAYVLTAWPLTEPTRIPEPDKSRAHFTMDIAIAWLRRDAL